MITKKCLICGNEIKIKEHHAKKGWGKYCSKKCQFQGQKIGKWHQCANCGKKIYRTPRDVRKTPSNKFFCSVSCHCSWENKNNRIAERAPNWKTGISVYRRLLSKSSKAHTCFKCGHADKRVLVVHHIDKDRTNNRLSNLEWICCNCHYLIHSGY